MDLSANPICGGQYFQLDVVHRDHVFITNYYMMLVTPESCFGLARVD